MLHADLNAAKQHREIAQLGSHKSHSCCAVSRCVVAITPPSGSLMAALVQTLPQGEENKLLPVSSSRHASTGRLNEWVNKRGVGWRN